MLKLPEERRRFLPSHSPLSFFRPRTYRKGYYFYSPQSSTVIKSKMAASTILRTRTRFRPTKIRLHCRIPLSFLRRPILMKVTVPFWFYCKLVWSNAEKYPDKLDKLFTLQNIANLQGIGFSLDFGFKIHRDLTKTGTFSIRIHALHCLKTTKRTQ